MTATRSFRFGLTALLALASLLTSAQVFAQANNGRGADTNRVGVSYYKTPPGKQDEWLALYKKYHRPIMDYQIKHGATISSTVYVAGNHAPGQPWDIAIINVSPPNAPKLPLTRGELILELFPDQADYLANEKRRWELTIDHWDESFVELDINSDTFSVYEPILPKKKSGK